jgi:hypothetical protein
VEIAIGANLKRALHQHGAFFLSRNILNPRHAFSFSNNPATPLIKTLKIARFPFLARGLLYSLREAVPSPIV